MSVTRSLRRPRPRPRIRHGSPFTALAVLGCFGTLALSGCTSHHASAANPSSLAYAASTCSGGALTQPQSAIPDSATIGATVASPSGVPVPPPVEFDVAATRLIEDTANNAIQGVTVNAHIGATAVIRSSSSVVLTIRVAIVNSSGSYPYSAADFSYQDSTGTVLAPLPSTDARLVRVGPIVDTGTLAANEEIRGSLAFDVATGPGTLRYQPRYAGCPAVSWTLEAP